MFFSTGRKEVRTSRFIGSGEDGSGVGSGTLGGRLGGGNFGVRSRAETGTVEANGDKKGKKMRR